MSIPHFFIQDGIVGSVGERISVPISSTTGSHMRSLRLRKGEHLMLVDHPGHGWELELASAPRQQIRSIEAMLISEHTSIRQTDLTLVQGISAADRMDQTIRQVTELAVARILPLESERSTVRLDAKAKAAKLERWQRIAQGAAEQSGQLFEPTIDRAQNLTTALEFLSKQNYDLILLFWEEAVDELGSAPGLSDERREAASGLSGERSLGDVSGLSDERLGDTRCPSLSEVFRDCKAQNRSRSTPRNNPMNNPRSTPRNNPPKVALFIGPEGGFSHDEARLIQASGAQTLTLGTTILRTETAAVVASALVLYHLGALGAR